MALRSPEELPTSEGVTAEKLGKWPVTVSTGMATEEGKYNAEVKEDRDVETDVVEGAVSPLIDNVGPCRSN